MKLNKYPDPERLYKCAKNIDALLKAEAIKPVYEPPITLYMNEIQTQIEDNCLKAVQSYGFNVDKDELKKALDYDRNQYDKGYADARKKYERPSGEWIKGPEISRTMIGPKVQHIEYKDYTCSNCGLRLDYLLYHFDGSPFYKFCPECGAEMRGG